MIPKLPRHLYVLVYKDKNEPLKRHTYCISCLTKEYMHINETIYSGNCPVGYLFCICLRDSIDLKKLKFDNSQHDILATIDGCKMMHNDCRRECVNCGMFKMIEHVKRNNG